jgi:hypothetical protein
MIKDVVVHDGLLGIGTGDLVCMVAIRKLATASHIIPVE